MADKLLCLVEGGNTRLNMFGYYALTLPAKVYLDENQINVLKTLGYKVTVLNALNEIPLDQLLTQTPKVDLTVETPTIVGNIQNVTPNETASEDFTTMQDDTVNKRSKRKS